jgi:hypothetical protein
MRRRQRRQRRTPGLEERLTLQTKQQTELMRRHEGERDLTYAERNDQRALEGRQQKLLTREEKIALQPLLTKLLAEAIDAKQNAWRPAIAQ